MKTKLQAVLTYLFILSFSVVATIYLAWLAYPLEIKWLDLESIVFMNANDISIHFNILMQYLTNPFVHQLDLPNFSSSADGLHHFEQVKFLFHVAQAVCVLTIPAVYFFFKNVIQKGYGFLFYKGFLLGALLPILLAFVGLLIGFDAFFTLFHEVLFVGDSTWLFNPNTDPVIYILPQEFFLHCFLLFFAIYEIVNLLLLRKLKNNPSNT